MLDADLSGLKETGTISGLVRVPQADRAILVDDRPVLFGLVRAPHAGSAVLTVRRGFHAKVRLSLYNRIRYGAFRIEAFLLMNPVNNDYGPKA